MSASGTCDSEACETWERRRLSRTICFCIYYVYLHLFLYIYLFFIFVFVFVFLFVFVFAFVIVFCDSEVCETWEPRKLSPSLGFCCSISGNHFLYVALVVQFSFSAFEDLLRRQVYHHIKISRFVKSGFASIENHS